LNVTSVLEGSVRRAGNRLRVAAQLINAADGYHVWSETYDRELADVFEVQDELTRSIVGNLRPRLAGVDSQPIVVPPTSSVEAYTLYLQGRFFWNKRTIEGYRRGIEVFEQALARDPRFALPYTGIADCWAMLGFDYFGGAPAREAMPNAKEAAERALELEPDLAEALTPLAVVAMLYDWDWPEAERRFQRALRLKPSYVPALLWYSYFLTIRRRHGESLETVRRAAELDPLSLIVHQSVARSLHYSGRYRESEEQCRRLLDMDPAYVSAYETIARPLTAMGRLEEAEGFLREGVARSGRWSLLLGALGHVLGVAGKRAEALTIVDELEERARRQYVPRYHVAVVYYGLHDEAAALREIERCLAERSGVASWVFIDPHLDWLIGNPRFVALARQIGLDPFATEAR
ncbi:MAG TPA: tetratricopeptide repeat protein, partial [Gemmatimonadales bacterium]|nr:tetratricopeptide repeat protein [Gemmatimonadales bacterium]